MLLPSWCLKAALFPLGAIPDVLTYLYASVTVWEAIGEGFSSKVH